MKWLSVKKYKPPFFYDSVLARLEGKNSESWLAIGFFAEGSWKAEEIEDLEESGKVTHFCIPDPIEIEEE